MPTPLSSYIMPLIMLMNHVFRPLPLKTNQKAGIYGDVIEEFDYYVGKIIQTLKETGIYENTIIVLSSDNAPMIKEGYQDGALENINGHNPYGNLRGEKNILCMKEEIKFHSYFPGLKKLKKTFHSDTTIYLLLGYAFATFADMLNLPITKKELKDSRSGASLFTQVQAPLYREYIMTQNNGGEIAIRKGKWKFLPQRKNKNAELYNLENDPSELHNLIFAYPQLAQKLKIEIEQVYNKNN